MQVIFHSMWLALPVIISFNHSAVSLSHASTHYFSHFYLTHLHPLVHNLYFPADPIFFLSNSLSLTRTHTHPYTHTPTHPHFTTLAISFSISVLGRSLNLWNKHNFTHNCRWHVHPSLEQILFASRNPCYLGTRKLKCCPSVSFSIIFITYLQCDQIWWKSPLCQKYLAIFWRFMSYFANLWHYWANFHCYKWPNIEK